MRGFCNVAYAFLMEQTATSATLAVQGVNMGETRVRIDEELQAPFVVVRRGQQGTTRPAPRPARPAGKSRNVQGLMAAFKMGAKR